MNTADTAKFNMVEQQIRPWEVLDNQVLSVLSQLNRADFVRDPYKGLAYADCQIPIAKGISMLPPRIEGRMLQALLLKPTDQVLQVGCGSGYLTACLAQLAERVISIDNNAEIIDFARSNVASCGQDQVEFKQLGLAQLDSSTDYDAIAVSGSMANVPQALKQTLKSGGRMFIVVGESPVMQALLITRVGDSEWTQQSLFETDLPRLNP
ncbi:MAG: protein-L-isoaspartate O-methyltransferase [Gammaproteobacteria bacterium]|nr:protein-L-isoaspartate O-methyltransferase [Gammaproteobacteria bacterium]